MALRRTLLQCTVSCSNPGRVRARPVASLTVASDWIGSTHSSLQTNLHRRLSTDAATHSSLGSSKDGVLQKEAKPRVSTWDGLWMKYLQKLVKFVEERKCFPNECDQASLSQQEKRLLTWCRTQRQEYQLYKNPKKEGRLTSMTAEREKKLSKIGFCFDLHKDGWMEQYRALEEYHEHHGDCLVPCEYTNNLRLGVWVGQQRYNYKKFREDRPSHITAERIALLDKLDFCWYVPDIVWRERYSELAEHVRINGPGSLPLWKHNKRLRQWAVHQQRMYQAKMEGEDNRMSDERIEMLDKLGFIKWGYDKSNN